MASVYVHSGAVGAGTGADWANAYTTLAAAFAAKAAGDDFWVAHDHAETQASAMTLTAPGTGASPNRVICASRSGSTPPVSADLRDTATFSTTGANSITTGGSFYCYGMTFSAGSGAVSASITIGSGAGRTQIFNNCELSLAGTSGGALNSAVFASTVVTLIDTDLRFASTAHAVNLTGRLEWRGGAIQGGALPTTLLANAADSTFKFEGVDLSGLGVGKTIFASGTNRGVLKDCKLGASVTIAATPTAPGSAEPIVIRCDSADTNYRTEKYSYMGTLTTETTIVRVGGASDGATPVAWKIITTANSKRYLPFEALPISIWNETTGSAITLTIEGIWGGGAVPTNANIWMDVEYLGTSGFPLGSFASSGPADQLAAGTNLSAGSGTWGGSTTKFKLEKTITPQEKGPITVYVKAALASSIFYLDPKISVS